MSYSGDVYNTKEDFAGSKFIETGNFKVYYTEIKDVYIIEPRVFHDARGYFFESYSQMALARAGIRNVFGQDNQSHSSYGTVRGLHFQKSPHAQAKLVRVLNGMVLDVAVDLRAGSKTYGNHVAVRLSDQNKLQLLVPRGFAHGFSVLSETAEFAYKCDNYYNKKAEGGIRFDDADLNINWDLDPANAVVSDKDKLLPTLEDYRPFKKRLIFYDKMSSLLAK